MTFTIHKLADVHPEAQIGPGTKIDAFTSVNKGVQIGSNSYVGRYCDLGVEKTQTHGRMAETVDELVFGEDSLIRGHSTFYLGSIFGRGLNTGHNVSVREGTVAGPGLQLGSYADLQGQVTIGRFVRIFNGAHICQWSTIGNYVWIFPYVVFTNDPTPPSDDFHKGPVVEDFAVIATRATLLPAVNVGMDSIVGANSLISKDILPGSFVTGNPARKIGEAKNIMRRKNKGSAYPWRQHFVRGFPEEEILNWPVLSNSTE